MKHLAKRGLALLLALFLCLSFVPAISPVADAATSTVEYRYDGDYIYNWGQRDTTATFLSPNAISYYTGNYTYEKLSALAGNSSQTAAHTSALYAELQELMTTTHTNKTSYNDTRDLYKYTDCENNGVPSTISSYYSGKAIGPTWDSGKTWNREHTWPDSKGLAGQDENDLMMLRPTAQSENSARGNTAYGESSKYYDPNSLGQNLRGDVARTMLCHYVRWGNTSYMWGTGGVMESKEILLKWMAEDPVDTWEMGRNDSAQSILGYRNVFIDYPELAFKLFEAEIPAGYVTPSGKGSASAYEITAVANNANFGTVSLSGSTINAFPVAGYEVAGYTLLSGTATITREGNAFLVSASSDCTVRINFQARTAAAVAYMENGKQVSTSSHYVDDSIYLANAAVEAPEGYTFLGWVTATMEDTTDKPVFYTAGSSYKLTSAATTFYALYSRVVTDTDVQSNMFEKYTGPLVEGDYLIVSNYGALQAALSKDRFVVITGLTFTDDYTTVVSPAEDLIWTAAANGDAFTFYNESTSSYAGGSGTKSEGALLTEVTDFAKWNVSQDEAYYVFENVGNQAKGVNFTLRRNANNGFACYAASTGTAIELYKRASGVVHYSTTASACEHSNTVNEDAVAATCIAAGYTAGVLCTDCNNYISGHELIAPLGHKYESEVTPPTETEQGYTTHTCSVCGDSYEDSFVDPVAPAPSELTVKEAVELGLSKEHDTYTEEKYSVTGVITEVYNTTYGNMKITDDEGNILTIYGTYSADGETRYDAMTTKPVAGDTVTILGIVGQYNGTAQIKNGWVIAHTASGSAPETPDTPVVPDVPAGSELTILEAINLGLQFESNTYSTDKYSVTGVIAEVYNTTYGNMKLADEKGNILTIYGTYSADGSARYDAMTTKPVAGDTVTILGIVGQYGGSAQIKNGWIIAHTPAGSTPETPDTPDTPDEELTEATLSFASTDNRTSWDTTQQTWEQNGIKLINEKAASTSNVANYSAPARFYKGSSVQILAANMAKIVITCSAEAKYRTAWVDSISSDVATVTTDGNDVIIELKQTSDSFFIESLAAQARANSITVYFATVETPVEGVSFSVSTSTGKLDRGETVTFTASVASGSVATEYELVLDFDPAIFEIVSGTCTVESDDTFFDNGFFFCYDEAIAYTGAVGTVTLRVKEDAPFGDYTVTFEAAASNGSQALPAEGCSAELTVECDHNYDEVVTKPTETEQGYTTFTCTKCGDSYVDKYTKPYGKTYTVTFAVPAGVEAIASKACNDYGITLPTPGIPAAFSDYKFAGWTDAPVSKTETAPNLYSTSSKFYTDGDITLYPVYTFTEAGSSSGSGNFQLVTNAATLSAGMDVIIVAKDYAVAMGTNQKSNNRAEAAITKNEDGTLTYGTDVAVFQLQDGTVAGTFAFYDGTGYLYAASSGSNYLRTQATNNDNGSWLITIAEDGTATVVAQGTNTRNTMQYNQSSKLFACYASASQKAMVLYARSNGTSVYYTSLDASAAVSYKVMVGENGYMTVTEALEDTSADYIVLLEDLTDDLYITSDVTIDLNGCILTADIQIEDGATLYLFDSATADYTADNRGGVVGAIEGNLATTMNTPASYGHNYKYLTIQEENGMYSAHRIYLAVKSATLVPQTEDGMTKISYKTVFKCSDLVASYVEAYGAQITGDTTVTSAYDLELAAGTNEGILWLVNSLSADNSDEVNAANALAAPAVSAYIQIGGEIIASASVSLSIQDLIVAADAMELTNIQKVALGYMYSLFQPIMDAWDVSIENIKSYGQYWN